MSLIEKVLEKAGKAPAEGRTDLMEDPSQPEQVVLTPPADYPEEGTAADTDLPARSPAPQGTSARKSRQVQVDLDRLRAVGMVTPTTGFTRIAEEYRRIKRPILERAFPTDGGQTPRANIVAVTSSVPNEGKSFTAINLAMSVAMELDRHALLIDADIASASLPAILGIDVSQGLVELLTDPGVEVADVMLRTDVPKLSVMGAGHKTTNVAELYASRAMENLIDELAQRYPDRLIIIDTPPVVAAAEATVLANLAGQVVFVVEAEKTPKHVVAEALRTIHPDKLTGLVLNKTNLQNTADSYYGHYGYGSP